MIAKEKGDGVAYARKEAYSYENKDYEADIQNGDKVTIKDAGREEDGQYGKQTSFLVDTRNGEKHANFNQASINVLVEAFGEESEKWVGKEVNILTRKAVIAGKKVIIAYFVTEGWSLDDYGDLVKEGDDSPKDDSIDPSDIPFD